MLGGLDPRAQGELLQVHQRDPQRPWKIPARIRASSFICVVNGTAAGGGYELALACRSHHLADDGSAVSLPEVPLLAVLPGTGGLTRVTDKRKVRRDHADFFCTTEEGVKGKRAVQWRLVDEIVPNSKFEDTVAERAKEFAGSQSAPEGARASR
jgi:benzoyl-CoA-dihydrodiol lyase